MSTGSSHARRALVVSSIAVNALTAGSLFCFPLIGPSLMADFALDLKQTNILWSATVLGEYLSAAAWGAVGDQFGPAPLSAGASALFALGYGLMAQRAPTSVDGATGALLARAPLAFGSTLYLAICFVIVGAGVGAAYFGSMTAATRVWPQNPSRAIAFPLTLFSLSSLFLTAFGERFFVDAGDGELDSARFLTFLAALLGSLNVFVTWGMLSAPHFDEDNRQAHGQGVRHQEHYARARVAAGHARWTATQPHDGANERTPLIPPLTSQATKPIDSEGCTFDAVAGVSGWSVRSSRSMLTPRSETL